ncbi:DUF427 domain-containing protein [Sphaerisporangium sp. NPDC005289]|uniref:DUF427 domain-containing protein n=1 Tax=Sphaerisporangium sp. NPDC005289 TaxID=3155247 RepID=UPI0033B173CB
MPATDTLNWEPSERWVRGVKGGVTVVDSPRPVLVWEPGHPVPRYAFPAEHVRADLLRPSADPPPAGPHAGATVFYDLVIGEEIVPNAAFAYPHADLADHVSFEWFGHTEPVFDHWYEEAEEIFVHPRDPYKRVDALPSRRHVRVEVDGQVLAETDHPVLLFETGLPTRYYIPPEDVRFDLLTATEAHTRCPYKGIASYWSITRAGTAPPNVAWAYPDPIPAAAPIKDHVAFYNEAVDIVVDGVKTDRPVTLFTSRLTQS